MPLVLRPHQEKAVDSVLSAIEWGETRIAMQAPVAFGKTLVAERIIEKYSERGERSIFVAPALSLIDQTVEKFYEYGLRDIGVIQADHPMTNSRCLIQVASAQTLMRRNIPRSAIVVQDEAHLSFKFMRRWMAEPDWQSVPFLGLSATPWSIGMGRDWKKLIVASTMRDMASQGWLKKLRYYCPVTIDASKIKIIAGDYHEKSLSDLSRGNTILSDTVKEWKDRAHDRPTIAFCVDRAHAQDLQARFQSSGVPCGYIDGDTPALERRNIGSDLESGKTRVVTSVGCLIAGLDWTFVSCILFAVKTKSRIKWVQAIGRGMRLHPAWDDCVLLDCAGNSHLGHPYDIHQDWLDDGSKKDAEKRKQEKDEQKEPRECPECGALSVAGEVICPECGHEPPKRKTDIIEFDAPMDEVLSGGKRAGIATAPATLKPVTPALDRQLWYSSLKAIQVRRGYKAGWCANQYREKFGDWPDMSKIHDATLDFPDPTVSSWVRHKMIKHAKGRQKAARAL